MNDTIVKRAYPHIDGLRALAVGLVLLLHLDIAFISGGFIGVDVFFVISGFLITKILKGEIERTGTINLSKFFCKRLRRLCPALLVVLLFAVLASIVLLPPAKFEAFGDALRAASLFKANIYFKQQNGYFDTLSQLNPLAHTWSLGVEMQFYIIWSLLIFSLIKLLGKKVPYNALLLGFVAIIFMGSFYDNLAHANKPHALYYYVNFRLFEFAIGAGAVWLFERWQGVNWQREIVCVLGFVGIFYAALSYDSNTIFPSYNALIPALGAALLILGGSSRYLGFLLRNKPVRYLGLISYSIYLVHWPMIAFTKQYHALVSGSYDLNGLDIGLIVLVTLGLSSLLYHCIEIKFTATTPDTKRRQWASIAKCVLLLVVFLAVGLSIGKQDLWAWRLKNPDVIKGYGPMKNYKINNFGGYGFKSGYQDKSIANGKLAVLLGDSHTGMLLRGFYDEIAKPHNVKLYSISGGLSGKYLSAFMLPGITNYRPKEQQKYDKQTLKVMAEVVSTMAQSQHAVLFISQRWITKMTDVLTLKDHKRVRINTNNPYRYSNFSVISKALDQLSDLIGHKKMVLIGNTPGSRINTIECFNTLIWLDKKTICPSTDNEYRNQKRININKMLAEYAGRHNNVDFINPDDVLCKKGRCFNVSKDHIPLYIDRHHFSITGSHFFIDRLQARILSEFDDKH